MDDHSLIFEEARKIEVAKEDERIPTDFKQLFNSIKASSGNKYHQITFDIKDGNCNKKGTDGFNQILGYLRRYFKKNEKE